MINANELRIGNYVNSDQGRGQVTTLHKHCKEEFKIGIVVPPLLRFEYVNPNISPIELTPEILVEKAGFEKIKGCFVNKSVDACHIVLIDAKQWFKVSITGPFGMVSTKSIKHLHQLQNLYFALTSEELPIIL